MNALPTSPFPHFPPRWATCFGEDDCGIFAECEVQGVVFAWRWIQAGTFMMGTETEQGRDSDEGPQHQVMLSRGFWLAVTPTTQAQWEAVTGRNPSNFKGACRPVDSITWDEVQEYVRKLNAMIAGLQAQLPTEAQWEYACRAGTESAFNDGSDCTVPAGKDPALDKLGWYDENSGNETHDVGLKQANTWGLFDMHGNVWEWCLDGMRDYTAEPMLDPKGSMDEHAERVLRGGSVWIRAGGCRSAYRNVNHRGDRSRSIGFRLAAGQELAEPEGAERPTE